MLSFYFVTVIYWGYINKNLRSPMIRTVALLMTVTQYSFLIKRAWNPQNLTQWNFRRLAVSSGGANVTSPSPWRSQHRSVIHNVAVPGIVEALMTISWLHIFLQNIVWLQTAVKLYLTTIAKLFNSSVVQMCSDPPVHYTICMHICTYSYKQKIYTERKKTNI